MTTVQAKPAEHDKTDPRSLSQTIHAQLRSDILRGTIAPGTQLRQENLAERFSASRIPVREALRQLEIEGLVDYQLNRGAMVIAMSTTEMCELLDVRAALETYAAKLAVPNMVAADIEVMTDILARYDAASDPEDWAEYNRQFHLAICAPSNNERLRRLIEDYCLSTTNRYPHLRMSLDTQKDEVQRDHYRIVDACKRRAADEVASLLEGHILETKREVMAAARHEKR
jgi:DNA-binding GntR family transcriptional regulator